MKYKLLVMDVDGTLTDGKIYMGENGELFKTFDVKDGYAIRHMLPQMGIKSAIITGRKSDIVRKRAEELNIDYLYQGVTNKISCLLNMVEKMDIELEDVIYIGDDVNDLDCIDAVGFSACPRNAMNAVKKRVTVVIDECGGNGAVRKLIEMIGEITVS